MHNKKLNELTIKDNLMFCAVMIVLENCHKALERILEKKILKIKVDKGKSLVYHPEYKGVRLDIEAEDEKHNIYNIEMQVIHEDDLKKRSRYYHSQIDMKLLETGKSYSDLPECYVIFICDFDPFGKSLYRYTFNGMCQEYPKLMMKDGSTTVFLNTNGKNSEDVSEELVKFLKYIHADLKNSENDFEDEYVNQLQQTVRTIKSSKEMEMMYMQYNLTLQKEWNAGRIASKVEDILDALSALGTVSDSLNSRIIEENNINVLKRWLKLAFRAESIEQFQKEM